MTTLMGMLRCTDLPECTSLDEYKSLSFSDAKQLNHKLCVPHVHLPVELRYYKCMSGSAR